MQTKALSIADHAYVLEIGEITISGKASEVAANPKVSLFRIEIYDFYLFNFSKNINIFLKKISLIININ